MYEWDFSPHRESRVGCEKCHGGNPNTFESFPAHVGVLNSGNPSSPVNRRNIPKTCGSCHSGPFVAFQSSVHYGLLQDGNQNVPVCTFPEMRVMGPIKAGPGMPAHGSETMPVWGPIFLEVTGAVTEAEVQLKIYNLMEYIKTASEAEVNWSACAAQSTDS